MIITLEEAQKVAPNVSQLDLDALEQLVRETTNNKFQDRTHRRPIYFAGTDRLTTTSGNFAGFRTGDTVEITGSHYHDGLYTVTAAIGDTLFLGGEPNFIPSPRPITQAIVTRIEYPPDVKRGVLKLLEYDHTAADRVGIKSRSVARLSETYADPGPDGYPAGYLGFLQRYRRMRWE